MGAVIGSRAGERQASPEMKVTAVPGKVMTAAAVIAVAVKAARWPFAVFVVPAGVSGLAGRGDLPRGPATVTTTGWTPGPPGPRSGSSRARDRRSPRRHAACHQAGRRAPAPGPGRALNPSYPAGPSARRGRVLVSLTGTLTLESLPGAVIPASRRGQQLLRVVTGDLG